MKHAKTKPKGGKHEPAPIEPIAFVQSASVIALPSRGLVRLGLKFGDELGGIQLLDTTPSVARSLALDLNDAVGEVRRAAARQSSK